MAGGAPVSDDGVTPAAGVAVTDADALADEYWNYHRSTAQMWNIDRGDLDQIECWEDYSPEGVDLRLAMLRQFEEQVAAVSGAGLADRQRTLLAAVDFSARSTAALLPYDRDLALVGGPFNVASFLAVLVPGYALRTASHGEGYITKLRSLPAFVDGLIAGVRDGAASGRVATKRGVASTIADLDALLDAPLTDHPLASQPAPTEASAAEAQAWRAAALAVIGDAVRPAVALLRTFLADELLASARADDRAGICHLPGGETSYGELLQACTSTPWTPAAVHALGLQQLAQLDDEYRQLGPLTIGLDDPAEIRERLRSDESFRYSTAADIVADATVALSRAEAEVAHWVVRLPQARCRAVAVTAGPMAFYTGPSADGGRDGTFFFNTGDPALLTRFGLEAITFHESVPGHHLQVALAQELCLHPVLGELDVTSYSEGWGLYAERLADEMSLYSGPLQRLGMLTMDSLRAARLVVDTGLHAFGWPRSKAVDFLVDHSALERRNAEAEIDRYIATPGQASSYMIGRLEIQRIRDAAKARLGDRFAIAEFHHVVLGNGSMPLAELARCVEEWCDRVLSSRRE